MPLPTVASVNVASFLAPGFLPHGYCYLWNKPLLWTHLVSDVLIGLSYVTISISLAVLMRRVRRDIPFSIVFVAFGLFIVACGMTHFMEVWTLWQPRYWLAGGVKGVTAAASVATAAMMPFLVPRIQATITEAKQSQSRAIAAERAAALEESNELLHEQAVEMERQAEESQGLAWELEEANAQLQETLLVVQASRDEAERARRQVAKVLDDMADGYIAVDGDWRIRTVNQTTVRLNGKPGAELIGKTLWEAWPATVGSEIERQYRRVLATGVAAHFEHHYYVSGEYDIWVEFDAYPAESGGLSIFFRDVTERKRVTAVLQEREAQFRTLADSIPQLAWMAGADGAIFWYNQRWYDYTGTTPEAMAGWGWQAVHDPVILPQVLERWNASIRTGDPFEMEFPLRGTDGQFRWFLTQVQPVRDAAGRPVRWFGTNTDISKEWETAAERERLLEAERVARLEAERQHREAEEARHAAEVANAAKGQFLAAMSHELRTPLNAICGYVQLLELGLRGPVTPEQVVDLGRIKASQQHLLGLINDVLNFTQLSAGRLAYRISDVPLDATLRAAELMVAPQIFSAGQSYVYEGCEPTLTACADRDKVQQIAINLLGNAMKFTSSGGRIHVSCESNADTVYVRVADTGRGIAADKLGTIFDPFVQAERRLNQPVEGIGLGLAISRELARGMGGDITVVSHLGRGSTFTLALPRFAHPHAARSDDARVSAVESVPHVSTQVS